jgi:hypothetical protein
VIYETNAIITDTQLGWEDHGLFTFTLHLDYGGSGQGACGPVLANSKGGWDKAADLLGKILKVVGVDNWEQLKGKAVVAIREGESEFNAMVRGLKGFPNGKTVMFDEFDKQTIA